MVRIVVLVFALQLGACATVASAPTPVTRPQQGLSPAQVSQGFMEAVVEGCAAALEATRPIFETALIVRDDDRPAAFKPRNGGAAWAPASAKGIVAIDEGPAACEVSAYGAPVAITFDKTRDALVAKGYMPAPSVAPGDGYVFANLSKSSGGRSILVRLSGNEPGARGTMSRFSTLTATVTAK